MAKELIKRWLNEDYWLKMAETHYKKIPKKIIIEKLIKNEKISYQKITRSIALMESLSL